MPVCVCMLAKKTFRQFERRKFSAPNLRDINLGIVFICLCLLHAFAVPTTAIYTGCLKNVATLFFLCGKCSNAYKSNSDIELFKNLIDLSLFLKSFFFKNDCFSLQNEPFFVAICKKEEKKLGKPHKFLKKKNFKENVVAPTNQVLHLQKFEIL